VAQDWLRALIAQLSGEPHPGVGDELHLTEDLHLDSLGRVQLAAAIEDRLGIVSEDGMLDNVATLGELRRLVEGEMDGQGPQTPPAFAQVREPKNGAPGVPSKNCRAVVEPPLATSDRAVEEPERGRHVYPRWPWAMPFQWVRAAFVEAVMRPLVWLLAAPRVTMSDGLKDEALETDAPLLIVANHVTTYDGPLIEYALPGALRRRVAVAMSGEMLEEYRRFHNLDPLQPSGRFFLPGPLFYFLLTAFFNVFPLPRRRNFQPSFAHAGLAMDRGFNVLIFPEGTRSAEGKLAPFRPGIGLLAKQCGAKVLPVAIRGLGELKAGQKRWFRSGAIEVVVGRPLTLAPTESEAAITARLHNEVARLLV
jgi:long-chain acyl-CoA synthetase